jgi:cytoskeletal protein RodZ
MQGFRYEQRKKKRMNRMLNVAISIVTILILFFAYQIFFGTPSQEVAMEDVSEQTEVNSIPDPIEQNNEAQDEAEEEEKDIANEEAVEIEGIEDDDSFDNVPDGEWQPIGTDQTEFTPSFTEGTQNRNEMEKAIRYATGISQDNMILWRIENGGSPTRVRGVISDKVNTNQPYEVYIEWIDGQGWMPVEKTQLSSNPYR